MPIRMVMVTALAATVLAACTQTTPRSDSAVDRYQRSVIVQCSLTQDVEANPCIAKARQACGTDRVRLKNVDSRQAVSAPVARGAPVTLVYNYSVVYYCQD
ncbi:hypothetical protein A6D6_00830 [Alcanivorax xiamenensis]|uniref:Lipoprotein n=1 Tax=Alcanivorax xiamenensis TaxID=1177156 RepID=A0ABQ6YBP3_9GAMM|nr:MULTISPECIES: hypothetical protein [Alcanivoracaceae]KAF0807278.1 hypothetical protein A6D6_00830 [Alcanivorax xiamenensis]SOC11948.1 hypothetical protein SAMN05877962_11113 [Alloalcanivorax xenomutans]